jgi:putative alpha-1,2-mannosidase
VGGLFSFSDSEVISRVGISWISTEQACGNVNREIPKGTSYASVVDNAVSEWNTKVLSKITTTNTNDTSVSLLYTSLYFMHLIPTNQTGENPGWTSSEPYYQDIFTFWVSLVTQLYPVIKYLFCAGLVPLLHFSYAGPATHCL